MNASALCDIGQCQLSSWRFYSVNHPKCATLERRADFWLLNNGFGGIIHVSTDRGGWRSGESRTYETENAINRKRTLYAIGLAETERNPWNPALSMIRRLIVLFPHETKNYFDRALGATVGKEGIIDTTVT